MLFILLATLATGLGAAGMVLMAPRLVGRRAPRWMAPAAGGLAMFAFTLWEQYSWLDRVTAALPEGAIIAETYDTGSWWQPWTLLAPRPTRAAVLLPGGPAEGLGGFIRADVLLLARFADTLRVPQLFDCPRDRRARLPGGRPPDDASTLEWTGSAEDPLIRAACTPAEEGDT